MAEESYLRSLASQLLELVGNSEIDSIDHDGKTYVDTQSIFKLLATSNPATSKQTGTESNEKSADISLRMPADQHDREEKYDDTLLVSPTICFVPDPEDNRHTNFQFNLKQTNSANGNKSSPIMSLPAINEASNRSLLGSNRSLLGSDVDDGHESHDLPHISWTGYALKHLQIEEQEKLQYYSNKELFIVLSAYALIYAIPGDKHGKPRWADMSSDVDSRDEPLSVRGILHRYDLLLVAAQQRDYTTQCYVRCLLPVPGWVYLPRAVVDEWTQSDLHAIANAYGRQRVLSVSAANLRLSGLYESGHAPINFEEPRLPSQHRQSVHSAADSVAMLDIPEDAELRVGGGNENYHTLDEPYIEKLARKQVDTASLEKKIWQQLEYDHEALDFLQQRVAPLTQPLPKEMMAQYTQKDEANDEQQQQQVVNGDGPNDEEAAEAQRGKCAQKLMDLLHWIVRWMRAHPFFPGLAITVIQAVIEVVIFFDIITDVVVIAQLSRIAAHGFVDQLFFTLSVLFFLSPYMIGWVATTQFILRTLQTRSMAQEKQVETYSALNRRLFTVAYVLFNIAPIGVLTLFVGDVIHLVEYVVFRPIAYLVSCTGSGRGPDGVSDDDDDDAKKKSSFCCGRGGCCRLRTISFEELGYWKLRRVSEIFAETIPQSVLQLSLLLYLSSPSHRRALSVSTFSVVMALVSSAIVCTFWIIILLFESGRNGMSFVEYMTVVFQGSFKFVPFLPAIERGKKTGLNVNWTRYRFDVDGLGLVAKSLISPNCKLQTLKISAYSIQSLHRNACKYFGKNILQYNSDRPHDEQLQLIVSREESDIKSLFHVYDIDDNWYFDFEEFSRCCLVMRKDVEKSVNLYTVSALFWELVGKNDAMEIYLLDLLIKMGTSTTNIPLLDFDNTLYYAAKNKHLNLVSLLMGTNYDKTHAVEYQKCVTDAVLMANHERVAMALCEEKGIPIVVQIVSATLRKQQRCNACVVVSIGDIEMKTRIVYNAESPRWHNEFLLFILPFKWVDQMLDHHAPQQQQQQTDHEVLLKVAPTTASMNAPRPMKSSAAAGYAAPAQCDDIEEEEEEDEFDDDTTTLAAKPKLSLHKNSSGSARQTNKYQRVHSKKPKKKRQKQVKQKNKPEETETETARQRRDSKLQSIDVDISARRIPLANVSSVQSNVSDAETYQQTLFAIQAATMHTMNTDSMSAMGPSARSLESKMEDTWRSASKPNKRNVAIKGRLMVNVKLMHQPTATHRHISVDDDEDGAINEDVKMEEEFVGGCTLKIDSHSKNTKQFHEQLVTEKLQIKNRTKQRFTVSGELGLRVYLNVLHKYDIHGLKYIDHVK